MIALVSPWLCATARNAAPSVCRPGSPNDVFEAPQVMFTPSSSRISRTVSRKSVTARGSAPTGIASGSMTTSSGGMPWSPAAETIFLATSSRRSGSIGISSSFARPITAAPCRATIGRIASSRSSSPVTELTSAFPSYAESPASSASITDESMQSGRSVSPCTSATACAHQLDLVRQRVADVDVEHVRAARDLLGDVDLELREVARLELRPGTPCGRSG